jgi:hypothetical protein
MNTAVMQFRELRRSLAAILLLGVSSSVLCGCNSGQVEKVQNANTSDKSSADSQRQVKSGRDFVASLQQALRSGDRNWIVSVTRFPVQVGEIHGTDQVFLQNYQNAMLDQRAFTRDYDKVWNPETVKVVMSENPDHFTGDHDHFAIGCGEVWFDKTKDQQFRISGFDISEYRIAGMSIQDCYGVRNFLARLQVALGGDRREQVAAMLKYPLRYHGESKNMVLHSARDVISNYDLIFSAKLRRAVAEQKPWTLEGSSEGIGIEGGFIWMSDPSQNGSFKVTSIFAPP